MKTPGRALGLCIGLATLGGCASLEGVYVAPKSRPEAAVSRPTADGEAARDYLAGLAELQGGTPAVQAETLAAARRDAEATPTTLHRLRYALLLACPGHAGSDPVAARRQLSDLLARPELLLPSERSLAAVLLADVDERLVLSAESRRVQQESARKDKERGSAAAQRLQAEEAENARLRRALEDAQKKLEAVTAVEQSITGRASPPKP
jgi:hypothetical protein